MKSEKNETIESDEIETEIGATTIKIALRLTVRGGRLLCRIFHIWHYRNEWINTESVEYPRSIWMTKCSSTEHMNSCQNTVQRSHLIQLKMKYSLEMWYFPTPAPENHRLKNQNNLNAQWFVGEGEISIRLAYWFVFSLYRVVVGLTVFVRSTIFKSVNALSRIIAFNTKVLILATLGHSTFTATEKCSMKYD